MLVAIFGESCTGKSTLAEKISERYPCEVVSGKDYLRLAKNEDVAKSLFCEKLQAALTGAHIVYVISEKEHLTLVPEGAFRILVTADLEVIKSRFAQRMRGNLPGSVAAVLEKKHGCFDDEPHDIEVVSGETSLDDVCNQLSYVMT